MGPSLLAAGLLGGQWFYDRGSKKESNEYRDKMTLDYLMKRQKTAMEESVFDNLARQEREVMRKRTPIKETISRETVIGNLYQARKPLIKVLDPRTDNPKEEDDDDDNENTEVKVSTSANPDQDLNSAMKKETGKQTSGEETAEQTKKSEAGQDKSGGGKEQAKQKVRFTGSVNMGGS